MKSGDDRKSVFQSCGEMAASSAAFVWADRVARRVEKYRAFCSIGNAGWSAGSDPGLRNRPAEFVPIWRAISKRVVICPEPFQADDVIA